MLLENILVIDLFLSRFLVFYGITILFVLLLKLMKNEYGSKTIEVDDSTSDIESALLEIASEIKSEDNDSKFNSTNINISRDKIEKAGQQALSGFNTKQELDDIINKPFTKDEINDAWTKSVEITNEDLINEINDDKIIKKSIDKPIEPESDNSDIDIDLDKQIAYYEQQAGLS